MRYTVYVEIDVLASSPERAEQQVLQALNPTALVYRVAEVERS